MERQMANVKKSLKEKWFRDGDPQLLLRIQHEQMSPEIVSSTRILKGPTNLYISSKSGTDI